VLGVPCIEFALTHLNAAGVQKAVVNTHAHAEKLHAYLKSSPVPNLNLIESPEAETLLGSAGGFRKALPHFKGAPFFSMNADVIHFADLEALAKVHAQFRKSHGVAMTLVLASGDILKEQTGAYREILKSGSSGLLKGFGEKKVGAPFYTGTAIFEAEAFSHLPVNVPSEFVPEVLTPMVEAQTVAFVESDALWIDIGSPELWALAQTKLQTVQEQGLLPPEIKSRLGRADPTCDGKFELGKTKIRLEDIEYEIKDIRNP
jgi:MurNAc alpha-1-phosphate uridylyltransferase